MTYVARQVPYIPGRSHVQVVCAILNQAHKLQIGCELLESPDAKYCYIHDGAESLQKDYLAQLLSRRDEEGNLHVTALDLSSLNAKSSEAQLVAYQESLQQVAEMLKEAGVTEEVSPLITDFKPTSSMQDRAAPACKAGRLVRGVADGEDDPTCAHHGITNVFEEGRKAIDRVLREIMNITDEQAAGDAGKVKAMRTHVGWFSSPSCSLIYQMSKYVALFSSKGYAVGAKFGKWMAAELHVKAEELVGEQLGHLEDLLAICGARDYVFFIDAAVAERFSQDGSLKMYLEEEAALASEAGGKLRVSILTGMNSEYIMAAVRTMALVCDSSLFSLLRTIGTNKHVLDVLPTMWTTVLAF